MRGVSSKITGGLSTGSTIKIDDNSGAKKLRIISRKGYSGRRKRRPPIGVGDLFFGSVIEGKVDMRKKVVRAVVIRQRMPFRRANGMRVIFEDNAAVLVTEKNEPKASEIKGIVAKEVAERFPKIATIAKNVI